jgi:hypothetical protein
VLPDVGARRGDVFVTHFHPRKIEIRRGINALE